jgi:superfamily II DNA or RNA helicase
VQGDSNAGHVDANAVDVERLRREVAHLRAENARLQRLLGVTGSSVVPQSPEQSAMFVGPEGHVDSRSGVEKKLALYRSLFAGRSDVYALQWQNDRTNRSGWVPAVEGGWRKQQRGPRVYLPLTEDVLTAHLTGEIHAGLYPLMEGDGCRLLVADFDGSAALIDALAYLKAARAVDVPASLEVSRSGVGAHVWTFFSGTVPASTARRIGAGLLREAMAIRGELDLESYDRFFPSQDFLPASGSIGNLIALPLQGSCRKRGTTLFIDLATLEPYDDQWDYLSSVNRLAPRTAVKLADSMRPVRTGPSASRMWRPTSTKTDPPAPSAIRARLGAELSIERSGLPPMLLAAIKHSAALPNSEFYDREKRRLSTYGVPRFVRCYREDLDWLYMPRGLLETATALVAEAGSKLELSDDRPPVDDQTLEFTGTLSPTQTVAFDALAKHELGVLVAPPGAGKTVLGCALIAHHGVPTLVLCDRKPLLDQWRGQVQALLGVKTGQLGAGRTKLSGVIDLASLQTLARRDDLAERFAGYGLVVVDECHHVPASAFERAVRQLPARRWLGLTATPYRRDKLDDLITMQCGPIRHEIKQGDLDLATTAQVQRDVIVHETRFELATPADLSAPGAITEVYRALVENDQRTQRIVSDVIAALDRGRHCLVLTQWTAHVESFAEQLREAGHEPVVLRGGLGAKARREAMARLNEPPTDKPLLAVATGSYLGEGFDCPALDTLFLAFPMVFKGRIVQYVGRVLRPAPDKTVIEVHDYVDSEVAVLARAHSKRIVAYKSLGFPPPVRAG